MSLDSSSFDFNAEKIIDQGIALGTSFLFAIVILVVGLWLAKVVSNTLKKWMVSRNLDSTVCGFLRNIIYTALSAFVIIAALAKIGIQTASFIAILGAAGLAIGLALQGSLANFAAGVLLILFRPFKIGDFINAAGESGSVEDVQIFTTILKTPDNRVITIPNANILGGSITNYSAKPTRRIDLVIGVSYDADLAHAKKVLNEVLQSDERILKDPEPTVAVNELADCSVNLVVRPWVNAADYWPTHFSLMETIKNRLDQEGIGIPYPQMDLHVVSNKAQAGQ